ncbi:MAG TPA: TMEM143 family protein [Humisphaera sp.]
MLLRARTKLAPAPPAPREQHLPVRRSELVDRLLTSGPPEDADRRAFRRVADLVAAVLGHEYHLQLQQLKDAYAPFDADADVARLRAHDDAAKDRLLDDLVDRLGWLLERANFRRLTRADIEAATREASHWGINLRVSFDLFDRLEVYYRGEGVKHRRTPRRWFGLRRGVMVPVATYDRLFVLLRIKGGKNVPAGVDTNSVHLKLFKDLPKLDLEMLLPGTRVSMSLLDRVKLLFSLGTGLGTTGYKLAGPVLGLLAGAFTTTALLGIAGGAVGYGVRSFYGYLQTKQKYLLTLAQSLYFLNLDNNAGVLFRLLDEAEEQEAGEVLLAYHVLLTEAGPAGWTTAEVDARAEAWAKEHLKRDVDFDAADAVAKLRRLNLARQGEDGRWRPSHPAEAADRLARAWAAVACGTAGAAGAAETAST